MKMRLRTEIIQHHRQFSDCENSDANIKIIFSEKSNHPSQDWGIQLRLCLMNRYM